MGKSTTVIEEFDTEGRLIKRTTETWDDDPPEPKVLPKPSDLDQWKPPPGFATGGFIRSGDRRYDDILTNVHG